MNGFPRGSAALLIGSVFFMGGPAMGESGADDQAQEILQQIQQVKAQAARTQIETAEAFLQAQKASAAGALNACNNASGVYDLNPNPDHHQVRFTYLEMSQLLLMPSFKNYQSVLDSRWLDQEGKSKFSGLLIETKDGWFWTTLKDPARLPYPSMYPETATLPAFEDFYMRGRLHSDVTVQKLAFAPDMLSARSADGILLKYNGVSTIEDFTRTHSRNVLTEANYLDNHKLRIPPEIYSLINDSEFIRNRAEGKYSLVLDMIYRRALEIMRGDVFNALFVSLLASDMRERGPCGAFYGKRGNALVPPSIFDGELPSKLMPNRLDSAQHLFGYALMAQMHGGSVAPVLSFLSKARQYYFPRISNSMRQRHSGDGSEADTNLAGGAGTTPWLIGSYYSKERTWLDNQTDRFYNELGIEFGRRAARNQGALPSSVLNDPAFDQKKIGLGLKAAGNRRWQAYDPNMEVPLLASLPSEKRNGPVPGFPEALQWMKRRDRRMLFDALGTSNPNDKLYREKSVGSNLRDLAMQSPVEIRAYCARHRSESNKRNLTQKPCRDLGVVFAFKNELYNLENHPVRVPTEQIDFDVLISICQRSSDDFERFNACDAYKIYMRQHLQELYNSKGSVDIPLP